MRNKRNYLNKLRSLEKMRSDLARKIDESYERNSVSNAMYLEAQYRKVISAMAKIQQSAKLPDLTM